MKDQDIMESEEGYQHRTKEDLDRIEHLLAGLNSEDRVVREKSRLELERIRETVGPQIVQALHSPSDHVRWEAAKALVYLRNPNGADAMVEALMDENPEVRWLAAEGLVALGYWGIEPLLRGLIHHFDSVWFREGAHHVLRVLNSRKLLDKNLRPVLDALEGIEPAVEAPWASEAALEALERR